MAFKDIVVRIFQLDKDWVTRITVAMLVMSVVWGILGIIDSLMVRVQETAWGLSTSLPLTPQEYYAAITLHGERTLFGFAQQAVFALFIYFTFKLLPITPRLRIIPEIAFVLINIGMMFIEGPILIISGPGFDNYFPATSWYYLAPLGLPAYSNYVVTPLFYIGWILNDIFVYLNGGWLIYHYYLYGKEIKEKLPIPILFFFIIILLFVFGYGGVFASNIWDILAFFGIVGVNSLANQIAFWIFGHAIVYMLWLPAVAALYLLIPILANRPLFSDKLARISAWLYLFFSGIVPIHHLYLVNLDPVIKLIQEILTYGVVVPSMLTFFNLWATTKGAQIRWNVISAFTATAFAGSIAAGVTGISNATIAFDAIVHNTLWVVGHFHTMILLGIVPAVMAVLYFAIPMISGRQWYSNFLAWIHYWGYLIGSSIMVVFFDQLGLTGILRRSEIYPLAQSIINSEVMVTIGGFIASFSTLAWFINLVLTLLRGRAIVLEGLSLGNVVETVAMALSTPTLPSLYLKGKSSNIAFLSVGIISAITGIIMVTLTTSYSFVNWLWIIFLIIGIFFIMISFKNILKIR
jgi:terminal oxidase heme-binding subunit I